MSILSISKSWIAFGYERTVKVFKGQNGESVMEFILDEKNSKVDAIKITENEAYIGAVFSDKHLIVWKVESDLNFEIVLNTSVKRRATALTFDSENVYVSDKSGDVYKYTILYKSQTSNSNGDSKNPTSKSEDDFLPILGHVSMLLDLEITHDNLYLITADRDEKIRVSHLQQPYEIESFCLGHEEFVHSVRLVPNNNDLLLSASGDGTIRLWSIKSGNELLKYTFNPSANATEEHQKYPSIIKISKCGNWLSAANNSKLQNEIQIFSTKFDGDFAISYLYSIFPKSCNFLLDFGFKAEENGVKLYVSTADVSDNLSIKIYKINQDSYEICNGDGINSAIGGITVKCKENEMGELFKAKLTGKTYKDYEIKKEKRLEDSKRKLNMVASPSNLEKKRLKSAIEQET